MVPQSKACAATPAASLRDRIMNPNIAKSEAEWWAAREIERLEEELRHRIAGQAELVEALKLAIGIADSWIHDQLDGTGMLDGALVELEPARATLSQHSGERS